MRKLAKIESPSPDEKKHISEEAMYIDQPVVDNAKNNKILYKRSMKKMSNYIYDEMVKEAYENIVEGFDKEAYHEYSNIPQGQMHKSQKAWKAAQNGASAEEIHKIMTNPGAMAAIKEHVMKHKGLYGAGAGTLAAAGIATGAYKALKNKKSKSQEEETAEKAAAYYEAAVMAKEAAEADYANACAYEDAALEILADLGYID